MVTPEQQARSSDTSRSGLQLGIKHRGPAHRYLAAKGPAAGRLHSEPDWGGMARSPQQKAPLQPASLTQHPSYATPAERSALIRAGRSSRGAALGGTPTKVPARLMCCWTVGLVGARMGRMHAALRCCAELGLLRVNGGSVVAQTQARH